MDCTNHQEYHLKLHHALIFTGVAWANAASAQLLPETTEATLHVRAELSYRDAIRARTDTSDADRWQLPWAPGFVEHWRDRRVGGDLVLRWTHVTACVQPAEPKQAGPCPGTYSVALELPALGSFQAPLKNEHPEWNKSQEYCAEAGKLLGAARIAGSARDGSLDCLAVLKKGCLRFAQANTIDLDLQLVAASVFEPLQACPDIHVKERLTFRVAK